MNAMILIWLELKHINETAIMHDSWSYSLHALYKFSTFAKASILHLFSSKYIQDSLKCSFFSLYFFAFELIVN